MFYCTACHASDNHLSGCKYEQPFRCPGCGQNVPLEKHQPGCGHLVPFECPDCMRWIPDAQAHHPNCDFVGLTVTHAELVEEIRRHPPLLYHPAQFILERKQIRRSA
jgi:hypothetical protein